MQIGYVKIYSYLLNLVETGRNNDMLPSQSELCSLFDVSHITVRRALDELDKLGLINRKKGKGTFVRKVQGKAKNISIAVVLPPRLQILEEFSGILEESIASGTNLRIYNYGSDPYGFMKKIQTDSPDGILWVSPSAAELELVEKFRDEDFPVMVLNRILKNSHLNYISLMHEEGAEKITRFFIEKGHRKIAFVGYDPKASYSEARYNGFLSAVRAMGSTLVGTHIVKVDCSAYEPGMLKAALHAMADDFNPTAIVSSQGAFLPDILEVSREKNIAVPDQWELATYDAVAQGIPEKDFIHEILQPLRKMGKEALSELEAIIRGEKGKVRKVFQPDIVIKEKN